MRRLRTASGALGLAIGLSTLQPAAALAEPEPIQVQVNDPRAFGYQVGDVVTRTIVIDVPRRLTLVPASLPSSGRVGAALELRRVADDSRWTWSGRRHTLRLDYQLFLAPAEPRLLNLPAFTLQFDGQPRPETWRIDHAPLSVAPLAPAEAPNRTGFGLLRPDLPPPLIDTTPERWRLMAYALLALAPIGTLLALFVGWPWWQRRQRPFASVQRRLTRLATDAPAADWLAAWRAVHSALNASAGHVLHAEVLDPFMAEQPRFASLRADLERFFDRSQALFFGAEPLHADDHAWLRAFCKRCADAERGLA
jgi:mxaA protein